MEFDLTALAAQDRYRLLCSFVAPRPIVLGQVVQMHVRDDCLDKAGRYLRPEGYQPIARMHADNYIVANRQFMLKPCETVE